MTPVFVRRAPRPAPDPLVRLPRATQEASNG